MSGIDKWVVYLHIYFRETLYMRLYIIWKMSHSSDNMAYSSVGQFLMSTLPLLTSHAVIKNNLAFVELLCFGFFPIIPGKELL